LVVAGVHPSCIAASSRTAGPSAREPSGRAGEAGADPETNVIYELDLECLDADNGVTGPAKIKHTSDG
jgi:hypothetical protein